MPLRSKVVMKAHDRLARAAEQGHGLRVIDLKRICPPTRNPFGVIWELRRHGAETAAIRQGREVVGWVLKNKLPNVPRRMEEPTPQTYVEYRPDIFGQPEAVSTKPSSRQRKERLFNPFPRGQLTKAGKKLKRMERMPSAMG
jgi:hypothetical protein